MRLKTGVAAITLILFTNAYADEPITPDQGAAIYDWDTCVHAKKDSCITDCTTTENIDCNDETCNSLAKDKCLAEGVHPPQ